MHCAGRRCRENPDRKCRKRLTVSGGHNAYSWAVLEGEGSYDLVRIAHDHGFYWGGHFSGRRDGMHFEVAQLA